MPEHDLYIEVKGCITKKDLAKWEQFPSDKKLDIYFGDDFANLGIGVFSNCLNVNKINYNSEMEAIDMKFKLIYAAIFLICLLSAISAGLLSVYRCEGDIMSDEDRVRIEEYVQKIKEELPSK